MHLKLCAKINIFSTPLLTFGPTKVHYSTTQLRIGFLSGHEEGYKK